MRVCGGCGKDSETVRFYPSIKGFCAECWKSEMRLQRKINGDRYALYERQRQRARKVAKAAIGIARALTAARCFVPSVGDLSKQLDKL